MRKIFFVMTMLLIFIVTFSACSKPTKTGVPKDNKSPETAQKVKETYLDSSWWKPQKIELKWGQYNNHPIREKLERKSVRFIWTLDFLLYFYDFVKQPLEIDEIKFLFSKYQDSNLNEFDRRRLKKEIEKEIVDYKNTVLSDTTILCVSTNVILGEYDFKRQGFPVLDSKKIEKSERDGYYYSSVYETNRFSRYFYIPDYTTTMQENLKEVNFRASTQGKEYSRLLSTIKFTNIDDAKVFPKFISISETDAEKLANELYIGKNCKIANAYIILKLIDGAYVDDMTFGVSYKSKEIRAKGEYVILFTKNEKVFAVYPKNN